MTIVTGQRKSRVIGHRTVRESNDFHCQNPWLRRCWDDGTIPSHGYPSPGSYITPSVKPAGEEYADETSRADIRIISMIDDLRKIMFASTRNCHSRTKMEVRSSAATTIAGCAGDVPLLSQMCPGMVRSKAMPRTVSADEESGIP